MARVPITVMGCRCGRCGYEWIPRNLKTDPTVCPDCHSPYWNQPRRKGKEPMSTYEQFRDSIVAALKVSGQLTWTEIRTTQKMPQAFPNNLWVRRLEAEVGLRREKDHHGIIHWKLG